MRNISCSLTTAQVRARTKTVTRRLGWKVLKTGDRLQVCEKVMGRRKGEPLVRLAVVEVADVRREPLRSMVDDPKYGGEECIKEGFPHWANEPASFVNFFIGSHPLDEDDKPVTADTLVTRIEWRYLD